MLDLKICMTEDTNIYIYIHYRERECVCERESERDQAKKIIIRLSGLSYQGYY